MRYFSCLLILLLYLPVPSWAQEKKSPKPDPVFEQVADVPGLPRVLIIGDSISMGYTLPVRKLFAGRANVHRIPENGGDTNNGVAKIDKWLTANGSSQWDVILFNWGLHDIKVTKDGNQVSTEQYRKNLETLIPKLRATGAKLIWASTTPVPEDKVNPPRKNDDVIKYNQVALKVMADEKIHVIDLYESVLAHQKEWQRPVNVHFNDKGSNALAERVHECIQKQLSSKAK